ncbi:Phosphopantetheine attachment site [Amycolatopsis marina]|uniref:Phosphopantetheine attachment site n=1 Tax=Amycolatopsis marina TaxID=490629 RepID=A0A1I0YKA4_9PSEU|nr:condensation domain-containing protein [Amycolatopsis marina]SFB13819.1 Phosphopantetheine attachment site [Amycolatopsis marina]
MQTDVESGNVTAAATPAQEAMWWLHQRAKDKSVYHITWRLAADRAIDPAALAIAWQSVVDRYDALRTSVSRPGEDVLLQVRFGLRAPVRRVEVDDPGEAGTDELLRLIAEEAQQQPMTLEHAPLARLASVRVGDRHELVLTVHHLILDGWGLQLVMEHLSRAYAAAVAGQEPEFGIEPEPFHRYAIGQRATTTSARWAADVEYWRNRLAGAVATTVAPTTEAEFVPGAPGVVFRRTFSEQATAGIAALTTNTFATPFAVFQAAMHIVLALGGAGPDVTIGTELANRMTPEEQGLVGYLANLCLSRAHVAETDRVLDVVTAARDDAWEMLAHQATPYPFVFGALPDETRRTLTDDCPVGLSHLGPIGTGLGLGDIGLTLLPSPNRAARADFSISTWEADGTYHAEVEYNTGRYDRAAAESLLTDLDNVLALGATDPERVVGGIRVSTRSTPARTIDGRGGVTAPDGDTESVAWRQVHAVWSDLLGGPPEGPDVDFFVAGGNSLLLLRLSAALEEATGVFIDAVEWLAEPTPRALVLLLAGNEDESGDTTTTTTVSLREGTGPHLHLIPGAGGGPSDFREITEALPPHWRVTASREQEPATSVREMARRFGADLAEEGHEPDLLGGWSMGGLVAYEMTCEMSPESAKPLVLLDSPPPVGYSPTPEDELFTAFSAAFTGADRPVVVGEPEFRVRVLAAWLAAIGQPIPAVALAERWRAYARHARIGEAYVRTAELPVAALIVGADLRASENEEWAGRFREPRPLQADTDHHGVLRAGAAREVAAAIVEFERTMA